MQLLTTDRILRMGGSQHKHDQVVMDHPRFWIESRQESHQSAPDDQMILSLYPYILLFSRKSLPFTALKR